VFLLKNRTAGGFVLLPFDKFFNKNILGVVDFQNE